MRKWWREEAQGSQCPGIPRSQGPNDLKVTFKYALDSKEGPSCIHIGIQIIICIWILLFIFILILRIHIYFDFENECYSYLCHIQKTNTIRMCSKITIYNIAISTRHHFSIICRIFIDFAKSFSVFSFVTGSSKFVPCYIISPSLWHDPDMKLHSLF